MFLKHGELRHHSDFGPCEIFCMEGRVGVLVVAIKDKTGKVIAVRDVDTMSEDGWGNSRIRRGSISDKLVNSAVKMKENGYSDSEIGRELGFSRATAARLTKGVKKGDRGADSLGFLDVEDKKEILKMGKEGKRLSTIANWVGCSEETVREQLEISSFSAISGAVFSDCRTWRYSLWRIWNDSLAKVAFIGLNPSTADEEINDPTVTRCINYAKKWGFGGMYMLNIFGYRATDPKKMKGFSEPIGERNNASISYVLGKNDVDLAVCAWGNHGLHLGRGKEMLSFIKGMDVKICCLDRNKNGMPKHPLYLKSDLEPVEMNLEDFNG